MKILSIALVLAGFATIAATAAADTVIVMPPVVIVVPRPKPVCSAPRAIELGSSERLDKRAPNGTVRVCDQGAL